MKSARPFDVDNNEWVLNGLSDVEAREWMQGLTALFKHDDLPLVDALYDADGNVTVPDLHLEEEEYE